MPDALELGLLDVINRQLLGIDRRPNEPDETADPAILI
jgi:hypothetical protein